MKFSYRYLEYEYENDASSSNLIDNENLVASGKVLVLNQSYEPISICSARKAVILVLLNKAELITQRDNRFFRSVSTKLPQPSIIKLSKYIRVPFQNIEATRRNVLRRDDHRCQYCGKKSFELTIDHIIPKSRGGADSWENLITACTRCNNKKGNRTPEEAGMPLLSKAKKPNHIVFLQQAVGNIDDKWKPFLFMD